MGYGFVRQEARMEFERFGSDGSAGDTIITFLWNLMPLRWKLKKLHEQLLRSHPPPAPLPKFIVTHGSRRFIAKDGRMVEEK